MADQTNLTKDVSAQYPLTPAKPEELPRPTFWPVMMAFSTLFFFWGIIASWIVLIIGLLAMGISIAGWIWELSDE